NYAQLCEQCADTLLIIPLASQCQALLEIGLSLGIVAQTLLDLPQIQQCSNESFFIIQLNRSIICTFQVVFSQAIETSQDKERGKGAGSRDQLGLFALIEGDFQGSANGAAFKFEQFVIFFVCSDVVGDRSDESTIRFAGFLLGEMEMGVVSDYLVE